MTWTVYYANDHKRIAYGTYKTEKEAQRVVRFLVSQGNNAWYQKDM